MVDAKCCPAIQWTYTHQISCARVLLDGHTTQLIITFFATSFASTDRVGPIIPSQRTGNIVEIRYSDHRIQSERDLTHTCSVQNSLIIAQVTWLHIVHEHEQIGLYFHLIAEFFPRRSFGSRLGSEKCGI